MRRFAVIENEIVTNVIVAESLEDAIFGTGRVCVEYTEENPVEIGWIYNGEKFILPIPEEIEAIIEEPITPVK